MPIRTRKNRRLLSARHGVGAAVAIFILLSLGGASLRAQEMVRGASAAAAERVVVTGTALAPAKTDLSDDPLASPSSVSVRTGEDLKRETIQSYGDIFRPVAGVSVSNYDQGNLGYGIALRGFDEGNHGGEVAFSVDGVPVNNPSNNFGFNGYTNLAPLLSELVESVAVYRGPFNVRFGNFALGGAVDIRTVSRAPSSLSLTGGSYDSLRGLGVYAIGAGPVNGYVAFEADTITGYRNNSDSRSVNSFTRLETPIFNGAGTLGLRAQIFSTAYGAPGYLDRAELEAGRLSDTAASDRFDGGSLTLLNFSTPLYLPSPDGDLFATLYVKKDFGKRWAQFGLAPNDDATQRLQVDDRVTAGASIEKSLRFDGEGGFLRVPGELTLGVSSRSDLVSQDVFSAVRREVVARTAEADFTQHNAAGYLRLQVLLAPWLKVSAGTRYDRFFYDVSNELNGSSIAPGFGTWSPKGGIAVAPIKGLSIFSNYGEGLRSPDATADLLANPDLRTAKMRSAEAGFSYDTPPATRATTSADKDAKAEQVAAGPGAFHFLADVYHTTLSNDVITGPDGATPVNAGSSRRRGLEVETSWVAYHREAVGLSLFANYSYVDAILTSGPVHQYVTGVSRFHLNYGFDLSAPLFFDVSSPHRFDLSVYHEIIGPKHLTGDGLEFTRTYTRLSAKAGYANPRLPGFGAFVGVVAYPDRRYEEAAFDFGDGLIGVSPKAPVSLQGGMSYQF